MDEIEDTDAVIAGLIADLTKDSPLDARDDLGDDLGDDLDLADVLTPKTGPSGTTAGQELKAMLADYRTTYGATFANDPLLRNTVAIVRLVSRFEQIDRRGASKLRYLRQQAQRETKRERPLCGAKTRAGGTCKARCVDGKARCRCHGGMSTGPKTEAGRAAIVASNKRRAGVKTEKTD